MRGYRKRPGTQGFSVPLVGASLFFIISLFLFVSYKNSAYQQAKKEIYSLYTANRAFDLDEVYQDGLTAIYAKEYGKTATEALSLIHISCGEDDTGCFGRDQALVVDDI